MHVQFLLFANVKRFAQLRYTVLICFDEFMLQRALHYLHGDLFACAFHKRNLRA